MLHPARRPLDPTELSWILEQKILGKIPIRMFPRPESPSQESIPPSLSEETVQEHVEPDRLKQSMGK